MGVLVAAFAKKKAPPGSVDVCISPDSSSGRSPTRPFHTVRTVGCTRGSISRYSKRNDRLGRSSVRDRPVLPSDQMPSLWCSWTRRRPAAGRWRPRPGRPVQPWGGCAPGLRVGPGADGVAGPREARGPHVPSGSASTEGVVAELEVELRGDAQLHVDGGGRSRRDGGAVQAGGLGVEALLGIEGERGGLGGGGIDRPVELRGQHRGLAVGGCGPW